jgi:hypothetical protein
MNKVDLYVNGFRLDLFDDEEITINLSVQNVQDISKVFTDFTQGFTIPASPRNNEILQHYYNANITSSFITTETAGSPVWNSIGITWNTWTTAWNAGASSTSVSNTFDGRLRQEARIEINSLPFRTGVVEIENVQLKGTEPYAYSLTFYGDLVNLTDLFGDDHLYDLNFSAYDHEYTDDEVRIRFISDTDADFFYPLMSPVKNWYYDSNSAVVGDSNIAANGSAAAHGIHWYELKPALKVTAVLSAIQAKYGITFTGDFLSSNPFVDLSIWLHRAEGYLFSSGNDIAWTLIDFNRNTGSGSDFNLSTETWTSPADNDYRFVVTMASCTENYELGIFFNGQIQASALVNRHVTSIQRSFDLYVPFGTDVQLAIRPQATNSITFQSSDYSCDQLDRETGTPVANEFSVDQTGTQTISFKLIVSDLMPEMRVVDFLSGIAKMHNLVIVPNSSTSFLLQPLSDWYNDSVDQNYQTYFDITQYTVNRPPVYREIEFKYQETEQILGFQYQQTNSIGFGDLRSTFTFDADNFTVEVPFECPLFERLTDERTGALTTVLVYKSITTEADDQGNFNPYLGAPVLFYGYFDADFTFFDEPLMWVDSDGTKRTITNCWYANVSNRYDQTLFQANSMCFGANIDPYFLQVVKNGLYYNYWAEYITSLYNKSRRLVSVSAVLPIGEIITLNLQNKVIWNNTKYTVNSVSVNMTTGKCNFELLNDDQSTTTGIYATPSEPLFPSEVS